jgi:hypothetical protein
MNDGPGSLLSDANSDKAAVVGTYGGATGDADAHAGADEAEEATNLVVLTVAVPAAAAAPVVATEGLAPGLAAALVILSAMSARPITGELLKAG